MGGFDVALGLRLTFSGSRIRQVMMVGGVAVGVGLLLGVLGVLPAASERTAKTTSRGVEPGPDRAEGVDARLSVGVWRGRELRVLLVETVGPPVAPPPGIPRTPGPGEVFASPELARALAGAHGAELAPRLPGPVIGQVGPAGLVGPEELYAVAGVPPGTLGGEGYATGFARPVGGLFSSQAAYTDGTGQRSESNSAATLAVLVPLAGVGLVVPVLVLVGTATRLSAATRERRASAIRLAGATPRQLRRLGGIEGATIGALGTVAGLALFHLLRAPTAVLVPVRDGLFATDVAPPLPAVLAVLVGVPVLTATAGVLALRRAVRAPLATRRHVARPQAGTDRLVPLAVGLLALAAAYVDRAALSTGAWHAQALLLGGSVACLLGIAVGAQPLSRLAGMLLARWAPGVAGQIAGRRMLRDPATAARAVVGTALAVVVVGWLVALLPVLAPVTPTGNGHLIGVLPEGTVVVTLGDASDVDRATAALRAVPGVHVTAAVRNVTLLPPQVPMSREFNGDPRTDQGVRAIVADCGQLAAVLGSGLPGCRPDTVHRLPDSSFDAATLASAGQLQPLGADGDRSDPAAPVLRLPAALETLTLPAGLGDDTPVGFAIRGDLLVPPSVLAGWIGVDRWFPTLLVGTDGRADTVEAVRSGLGATLLPLPPATPRESVVLERSESDGYRQVAVIVALAVVLTGGLSLAVTTTDAIRERRRAHAALTAIGVPARLLRRSVLLHTALPLLLSVGLAIVVTSTTSWLYVRLLNSDPGTVAVALPWTGYVAIGVAAVAACVLATAAALPLVRSATRPDALRSE
ncbi:ABC transporter permease [Plantactinospora sonchi]|uniref:ABC transporter permease n=1 Tax=Plantactinospora sonchi TaxID=1544735 RepID=A0ABU7S1Z2_9ACTN